MKFTICIITLFLFSCSSNREYPIAKGLTQKNPYFIKSHKNLLNDFQAKNKFGDINVVIEIPAGTNQKWEVEKENGNIKLDFRNGKPRYVDYLAYPGNYGMVPRTLLPKELGGDGDPLDVLVIGHTVPRGEIVEAKLLGVLTMLDRGEQDDKLIAALKGTPFYNLDNLDELNKKYKNLTKIIELWFTNYKGPGKVLSQGFKNKKEAEKILNAAIKAY